MLRLQPKTKERRKVAIPDDLRYAMREVMEILQEAKNDPDIQIGHGDAIQVGPLCGGRCGQKPRPFEFTYHHEAANHSEKWYLAISKYDIEDIGDGRQTEITLSCCLTPSCGNKFTKDNDNCKCDYVDDPNLGTFDFPIAADKLALRGIIGFTNESNRQNVIDLMGEPIKTGGGIKMSGMGYIPPWIAYKIQGYSIVFRFGSTGKLSQVTIEEKSKSVF